MAVTLSNNPRKELTSWTIPWRWRLRAVIWGASLGDRRRTQRLIGVAKAFAEGGGGQAGGAITSVIRDRHQAKAAYRLLDNDRVTHEAVIAGHCAQVLEATASPGDYLLIEDTTSIAYPGLKEAQGLGPIGEDYTRGLWAHQTLAVKVDWERGQQTLLGLLGQRVWARPPVDKRTHDIHSRESNHARQLRDDRESQRWMTALDDAGGALDGTTWTYVADRESDIYELFQRSSVNDWSYVIRASQPRSLAQADAHENLLSAAASAPVKGCVRVALSHPGCEMLLEVRATTLTLRGPSRPGGRLANHTLNVVYARQLDAAAGQEPACWILLTDLPINRDFPVGRWPTNTAGHRLGFYHRPPPQQRLLFIF